MDRNRIDPKAKAIYLDRDLTPEDKEDQLRAIAAKDPSTRGQIQGYLQTISMRRMAIKGGGGSEPGT